MPVEECFNYHEYYLLRYIQFKRISCQYFFLQSQGRCYKTLRAVQIRWPVKSLFSRVSYTIGIRIRSWKEVRYSNELANLLLDPCTLDSFLILFSEWKNEFIGQIHTFTMTETFLNKRLYKCEKYTLLQFLLLYPTDNYFG